MGNQIPSLRANTSTLLKASQQDFITKTLFVHSPEHHRQLISLAAKFKQLRCPHLLHLVDSHSVQQHSLCSVVSQLYLLIERPTHTLASFHLRVSSTSRGFNTKQIVDFLLGCCRAVSYLLKEGFEVSHISEEYIFVEEDKKGNAIFKILPPLFGDESWTQNQSLDVQIAMLVTRHLNQTVDIEIRKVIQQMAEGQISMRKLEELLGENKPSKLGLKLTKGINQNAKPNQPDEGKGKPGRQSLVSNTSSLMIDAGDFSDLMFRHFYQNFDDSISQIAPHENETGNESICEEASHQFPKRYLKSKAFRRSHKYEEGEVESTRGWSDWKSEGQNLTRDQSGKENIGLSVKPSMFSSAKFIESPVGAPIR